MPARTTNSTQFFWQHLNQNSMDIYCVLPNDAGFTLNFQHPSASIRDLKTEIEDFIHSSIKRGNQNLTEFKGFRVTGICHPGRV